jgi:hypothetical protein
MSWKAADTRYIKPLELFLRKHEIKCVSFSSKIKSMNPLTFFKNNTILINTDNLTHEIEEAVLFTRHGLVLPILNNISTFSSDIINREKNLKNYSGKLFSILGIKRDTVKIQSCFNNIDVKELIDYHLMILDFKNIKKTCNNLPDFHIRKAGIKDTDFLLKLQRNYEMEEVLLDSRDFNKKLCIANLKNSLKTQIIYCAEYNGKAVSKAGTNARGFKIDQIGGVYTDKKFRGRNISLHVLQMLFTDLNREKKAVCLFVKKSNPAAINLYLKLGFEIIDQYRIVYYQE